MGSGDLQKVSRSQKEAKMSARSFHRDGTSPRNGEIFVFGSNLAGRHGAGAALAAVRHFGATYGVGIGLRGQSYAVPTKDREIRTLPLFSVRSNVEAFIVFASRHPELKFFVTRIGCGLAGFDDATIAPLFTSAPPNCCLPEDWRRYVEV
jgi:hypothetical protein